MIPMGNLDPSYQERIKRREEFLGEKTKPGEVYEVLRIFGSNPGDESTEVIGRHTLPEKTINPLRVIYDYYIEKGIDLGCITKEDSPQKVGSKIIWETSYKIKSFIPEPIKVE